MMQRATLGREMVIPTNTGLSPALSTLGAVMGCSSIYCCGKDTQDGVSMRAGGRHGIHLMYRSKLSLKR